MGGAISIGGGATIAAGDDGTAAATLAAVVAAASDAAAAAEEEAAEDPLYSLSRPASSLPDAARSQDDDDDDEGLRGEDDDDDAGVLGGANAWPFDAKSDRMATEGIEWRIVYVVSLVLEYGLGNHTISKDKIDYFYVVCGLASWRRRKGFLKERYHGQLRLREIGNYCNL